MRESKTLTMSRIRRYYQPHISGLIQTYDRKEVQAEAKWRQGKARLEAGVFEALGDSKPSLPDSEVRAVGGRASWTSTSALGLAVPPFALMLAQHLRATTSWHLGAVAWLAMFCLPGTVLQETGNERWFLVLEHTEYAVLVWPLHVLQRGGRRYAVPEFNSKARYSFEYFFSLENPAFVAWPYSTQAPLQTLVSGPKMQKLSIVLALAESSVSILQAAAQQGFRGVTQEYLEKLSKLMGWPWAAGDSCFLGRVERLIRHVCPEATDEQVISYLATREPKVIESFIHNSANLQQVDALFEVDERVELKDEQRLKQDKEAKVKQVQAYQAAMTGKQEATGSKGEKGKLIVGPEKPLPKAAAAAAAAKAKAGKQLLHAAFHGFIAEFLPAVPGCRIQPVPQKRSFCGEYPREHPPFTHTCTWSGVEGKGIGKAVALRNVVRWCWAAHLESTGEACAVDVDSLVLPPDVLGQAAA